MKKRIPLLAVMALMCSLMLAGCGSKVKDEAIAAVDAYNEVAKSYNESIAPYNEAVERVIAANTELSDTAKAAQDVINKGEDPFDPETLTSLKKAMSAAQDAKVSDPAAAEEFEILSVSDDMKTADLKALTERATTDIETVKAATVPDAPETPDYSEQIEAVKTAQKAFEDSIQGLKQVTAPSDEFVMERLQRVDTITMMDAVTEDHDPNGKLGKQGGYIGCVYFRDSQVDQSQLYVDGDPNDVIDVGTDGGGALEIFSSVEDAQARDTYLAGFDGTMFVSGSHYIVGTILVRTSDELSGTKQQELTDKITQALIAVD